jgi:trk system potassium uptake protein TrkA
MKIVIMGCGRIGARLANMLDSEGHEVSIIDLNPEAFARLNPDFHGQAIVGTGIDEDVLKGAGIATADAFVAVTTTDNRNIMASQIDKHVFNVPEVLCLIYDPVTEDTYHLLGLDTVCPTTMISNVMREHVLSAAGRTPPAGLSEAPVAR